MNVAQKVLCLISQYMHLEGVRVGTFQELHQNTHQPNVLQILPE